MTSTPECPYCGTTENLREAVAAYGSIPADYICGDCFTPTDDGPMFDDLPEPEGLFLEGVEGE